MLYYRIFSNVVNNNTMCLDLNSSNETVINYPASSDTQLWTPVPLISGQSFYGTALMNKATGLYLNSSGLNEQASVVAFTTDWSSVHIGWDLGSNGALNVHLDNPWALNVQGEESEQGTSVIVYPWQGGNGNETWAWSLIENS